jgi:hypothetical protein
MWTDREIDRHGEASRHTFLFENEAKIYLSLYTLELLRCDYMCL